MYVIRMYIYKSCFYSTEQTSEHLQQCNQTQIEEKRKRKVLFVSMLIRVIALADINLLRSTV